MAIVDITIDDLAKGTVVGSEWQGTGVFDTLISAVNKNIEIQYTKGRITGKDYAEAYVLALQTTLQQSVEFLLRRDLAEAQLADTMASIALKEQQLAADRDKVEAELEKQWGYDVIRDTDGSLILGASTGNGKIDKDIAAVTNSIEVSNQETALKERQVIDQELTGEKQRLGISADIELKETQRLQVVAETLNVPKQGALLAAQKDIQVQQKASQILEDDLKVQELEDKLLTSTKQRLDIDKGIEVKEVQRQSAFADQMIKDKQAAMLGLDNVVKNKEAERLSNPTAVYTPQYEVI